jgi:hypothetical protein
LTAQPFLSTLVAEELSLPVDPRVTEMAGAIAALYSGAARAVLFYGSCLREKNLDGLMLDFYLIVSSYREAYGRGWYAFANRLIPPNVFPFEHDGLAAKYAVLSEADFARECSFETDSVSVWARFAQPSRLVWASDEEARQRTIATVAQAAPVFLALALPANPGVFDPLDIWRRGFDLTYKAELRAERTTRAASIVDTDPERYRRFFLPAMANFDLPLRREPDGRFRAMWVNDRRAERTIESRWKARQRRGKLRSLVRLAKATTTFAGGVDYIAWKINRHAGTQIVVKPWQRRWPILGALTLLPRLWRRGAIR